MPSKVSAAVSYTHLDVYKRQPRYSTMIATKTAESDVRPLNFVGSLKS